MTSAKKPPPANVQLVMRMTDKAKEFGKHDLERLGIFIEMPYMNGKGYVSPFPKPKSFKGRGTLCNRYKCIDGTMGGYFNTEFMRLYEGEGIKRPIKKEVFDKINEARKGKPRFLPPGRTKRHACPGDFYGTFGGVVEAMSRKERKIIPRPPGKRSIFPNPPKKGGYGYPHMGLSKDPEYIGTPYPPKFKEKVYGTIRGRPFVLIHWPQPYFEKNPYFEEKKGPVYIAPKPPPPPLEKPTWILNGPAKSQGGCHAGLFSPFPEYKSDRNRAKEEKVKAARAAKREEEKQGGGIKFVPQPTALKTMFTTSVLKHSTDKRVNATNFKTYEPIYIKHLI